MPLARQQNAKSVLKKTANTPPHECSPIEAEVNKTLATYPKSLNKRQFSA